jgi:Tol biopolymer transport system component
MAALAVAGLATAGAALVWTAARQDRATPPAVGGGRLREVLSSGDRIHSMALSGDGKMVAYVLEQGGRTDLYVSRAAGGAGIRVTSDDAREAEPQFSPDGERILFTWYPPSGSAPELRIVPTFGGHVTPVLAGAIRGAWSPDGMAMACVTWQPPKPQEIVIAHADGSNARILLKADSKYPFFGRLAWSPDGTALAIGRSAGGVASELWTVQVSNGSLRRLWTDPPGVYSKGPAYAPDGSGIVHVSNRGGATNLWFLPADGRAPVRLTSGAGPDLWPSISASGAIAFLNAPERSALWVYDLGSGARRTIVTHSSPLWAPAFSPDGQDVAYSRAEEDGSWHVWISPLRGGEPRRLTSSPLPEVYPRFFPDGEWLAYSTWSARTDRIWRVPRRGGPAEPLTPDSSSDDQYADPSPDGRRLAFARTTDGETHVVVQEMGRGEARRVTKGPSTLPRWSPDGRWIAFSADRTGTTGVFAVTPEGGDEHRISDNGGWPVWWPDGTGVAYSVLGFDDLQRVRITAVAARSRAFPTGLPVTGRNTPFDVARDGRSLAITDSEISAGRIWILESPDRGARAAR